MTDDRREIGLWTAVALVVGNMIGSGVFLLPASLAPYGGLSLVGWGVSTAGSVLLALVFARLARVSPAAGGPYAYTREAFGDLAGFLVGWGYWISTWCTNAALAIAFVGYLDPFVPSLVRTKDSAAVLAIAAIWVFTLINARGVRAAGRVQVVTTVLKAIPLLVIGVLGLAHFDPAAFDMPELSSGGAGAGPTSVVSGVMAVVTLTLWAFLGLECATIPAGSVRDAARVIPRATIIGTLVAAAVYVVSTVGVMSLVPAEALARSTAPFADAARTFAGDGAAGLVAIGAAVSCLGALNGWTLMVGHMPMAMAADGLFPAAFARRSARGVPAGSLVIGAVLSSALLVADAVQVRLAGGAATDLVTLFTRMILIATLSTLVPYAFSSLVVLLRPGRPATAAERGAGAARVIGALAFAYAVLAIAGAGAEVLWWGSALLAAGLPVYFWMVHRRSRAPAV